jgi:hypothetical protein
MSSAKESSRQLSKASGTVLYQKVGACNNGSRIWQHASNMASISKNSAILDDIICLQYCLVVYLNTACVKLKPLNSKNHLIHRFKIC